MWALQNQTTIKTTQQQHPTGGDMTLVTRYWYCFRLRLIIYTPLLANYPVTFGISPTGAVNLSRNKLKELRTEAHRGAASVKELKSTKWHKQQTSQSLHPAHVHGGRVLTHHTIQALLRLRLVIQTSLIGSYMRKSAWSTRRVNIGPQGQPVSKSSNSQNTTSRTVVKVYIY